MTNGRYIDIENEVLRNRIEEIKAAAWHLLHLIDQGGEVLNDAIDNLKAKLK